MPAMNASAQEIRPPTAERRVYLIDDHSVVREGLRRLIDADGGLVVSGEASTAKQALASIDGDPPDLVLVDIALPGIDGIELIKALRARFPRLLMLVLS